MFKVSVVIPTFNHSSLIVSSLESWTRQTLNSDNFEVIVVDNNSTDKTEQIARDFIKTTHNFKYLKEFNVGSTFARHAGARISKGEILVFADDDGLFNENCLSTLLDVYKLHPEVAAVTGKIELQWDSDPPVWIKPYEFMLGKLDYGDEIKTGNDLYLNGGLFAIRKTVFEEMGGFNPDLVGDYLVGDGDTGLVRKLHAAKQLIGYTPFACMQHLQFVEKHGTEKDMGRRFYNIGISDTYANFRANQFKLNAVLYKQVVVSGLLFIKKYLEFNLSRKKNRKHYFSLLQRKGELAFFKRWLSKSFRNSCKMNIPLSAG